MIAVTPNAVAALRDLLASRSAPPDSGLRLLVQKGGCAGFQYAMKVDQPKPGDTLVPCPGLGIEVCPSSGIGASYLMWALQATVIEEMLARGKKPSVYMSNHAPGATAHNAQAKKTYLELGY